MSAYRVVSRVADLSDGATVVTTDASQTISGAKTLTGRLSQTAPSDNIVTVLSPYTADPTTNAKFYKSVVPQSNSGLGGSGYDLVYTAGWNVIQSTLVDTTQHGAGMSIEYGWYNGPDTTRQTEFHAIRFVKSNGDGTGTEFRALSSVSPWNDVGNIATDFTANTLRVSDQLGRVYYSLTSSAASSNAVVQWVVSHPNGANILDLYGDTDTTGQVNIGGSGNTVVLRMVDSTGTGRITLTPGPDPYIQFAGSTTPAHPQISFADNCSVYAYGGSLSLTAAAAMYCYVHTGSGGLIVKDVDNANATIFTVGASSVSTPLAIAPGNGSATGPAIWGGTGAPSSGLGADGDFYDRSDGTVAGGTLYYHKESGSWVAFAGGGSGTVTTTGTPSSGDLAFFSGSTSITNGSLTTAQLPLVTVAKGGTGLTGITSGRIPYATATDTIGTSSSLQFSGSVLSVSSTITVGSDMTVNSTNIYRSGFATLDTYNLRPRAGSAGATPLVLLGTTSQTAPLQKLQQLISGTAYDAGITDAGWVNGTPATRTGYFDTLAPDYTGTNKRGSRTWSDAVYGRHQISAPPSAPTDAELLNSMLTAYQDEGSGTLILRVRKSDGTYGKVTLTVTPG